MPQMDVLHMLETAILFFAGSVFLLISLITSLICTLFLLAFLVALFLKSCQLFCDLCLLVEEAVKYYRNRNLLLSQERQ
jgi:hypothetical protein